MDINSGKALPGLLIPGAQKCGSTALAHYLSLHPGCSLSSPKEPTFFSRLNNLDNLESYSAHFDDAKPGTLLFEASTGYLFESYVPGRIARSLLPLKPDLKMLIILRRPADRVISAFLHLRKRMDDKRSLQEVLGQLPDHPEDMIVEGKQTSFRRFNGKVPST